MKCGIICKIFKSLAKNIALDVINQYATNENISELTDVMANEINKKYGVDKNIAKAISKNVINDAIDEIKTHVEQW